MIGGHGHITRRERRHHQMATMVGGAVVHGHGVKGD